MVILFILARASSVFNSKYQKQKQSTRGTDDFEKVLCFLLEKCEKV
jgi:hypothetical protein